MRCANATELFFSMYDALDMRRTRTAGDGAQPRPTFEAPPGSQFVMSRIDHNVCGAVKLDYRWAAAYALHFFTGSEEAASLRQYNGGADRFLTHTVLCTDGATAELDGTSCLRCSEPEEKHTDKWLWRGAYGSVAMPQVRRCVEKLNHDKYTRRAIVNMAGLEHEDINRPHCWSTMHFLYSGETLDLLVYQRSLNLALMPTDIVCLTNALRYMALSTGLHAGRLIWTIGSLHAVVGYSPTDSKQRNESILFPLELLSDPTECGRVLTERDHPLLRE